MKKALTAVLLLALALCAGCVTHDMQTIEYSLDENGRVILDQKGKPVIRSISKGSTDVEMEAVKFHGLAAAKMAEKAPELKTVLKTPILVMNQEGKLTALTDAKGNPVTITAESMDSGIMAAITKAANTTGHSSQGVKIANEAFGFGRAALNPALTFGIAHQALKYGTGSNNSKTYNSSFNNPNQSPQTVDNVAAHVTANPVDSHNTSNTTTTENNTNETPEAEEEPEADVGAESE